MPWSEIAQANAIVAAVTHLLDHVAEEDEDTVLLRLYADEEAFRLVHPEPGPVDNALHARIARTAARAAWRIGHGIAVLRLRAAPMRAWLARQPGSDAADYPGEPEDRLTEDAALRALGLNAAELKEAPRKPAQGRTLAARIARWATDPEAEEDLIVALTEEMLSQRLDGALGVLERMLEAEDYAYARHEIDLTASASVVGEPGREREALLFVCPVLRDGADPRPPAIPADLQGRLTGIALDRSFVELILAPCWIPTAALPRLTPSVLREAAEALANGIEPPVDRAAPEERDVCLLGLTIPMPGRPHEEEEDAEAAGDRLEAWLAVVADAAGGGRAEPPLSLARALDLLRRVKLAVPDEAMLDDEAEDEADQDGEEAEPDAALVEALAGHLGAIGTGSALLTGADGAVAIAVAEGVPDLAPGTLRDLLADALLDGGILFVVPAAGRGAAVRGHAFLLEENAAEGLSAADARAAFADEAPEDWAAAPAGWADAPPLDYDPAAG